MITHKVSRPESADNASLTSSKSGIKRPRLDLDSVDNVDNGRPRRQPTLGVAADSRGPRNGLVNAGATVDSILLDDSKLSRTVSPLKNASFRATPANTSSYLRVRDPSNVTSSAASPASGRTKASSSTRILVRQASPKTASYNDDIDDDTEDERVPQSPSIRAPNATAESSFVRNSSLSQKPSSSAACQRLTPGLASAKRPATANIFKPSSPVSNGPMSDFPKSLVSPSQLPFTGTTGGSSTTFLNVINPSLDEKSKSAPSIPISLLSPSQRRSNNRHYDALASGRESTACSQLLRWVGEVEQTTQSPASLSVKVSKVLSVSAFSVTVLATSLANSDSTEEKPYVLFREEHNRIPFRDENFNLIGKFADVQLRQLLVGQKVVIERPFWNVELSPGEVWTMCARAWTVFALPTIDSATHGELKFAGVDSN